MKFTARFFKANRQRLLELSGVSAPIVVTANGHLQRSGDTTFPFRQDSNFWYLTGIEEPDITLVLDRQKEYLIVPDRSSQRAVFDGAINAAELSKLSGIETVLDSKKGWHRLNLSLKRAKQAATLLPPSTYIPGHGFYTNPARQRLLEQIKEIEPKLKITDLRPQLADMRAVKQPQELLAIQQAIDLSVEAFKSISKGHYNYEYEIEAEIGRQFGQYGYEHAYQPIVASGQNACTLHYVRNNSKLGPKDLVLIDAGAEVSNYTADITRTYALSNKPTRRQIAIHTAVLQLQDFAISLLKPGILLKDYENQVRELAGKKLRELGLIKTNDKAHVGLYYPHATSHFLGLDVHDVGDYKKPLQSGMVLTVEPGIYVAREGIGVRIEDDIVITKSGRRVLSKNLPTALC